VKNGCRGTAHVGVCGGTATNVQRVCVKGACGNQTGNPGGWDTQLGTIVTAHVPRHEGMLKCLVHHCLRGKNPGKGKGNGKQGVTNRKGQE